MKPLHLNIKKSNFYSLFLVLFIIFEYTSSILTTLDNVMFKISPIVIMWGDDNSIINNQNNSILQFNEYSNPSNNNAPYISNSAFYKPFDNLNHNNFNEFLISLNVFKKSFFIASNSKFAIFASNLNSN